MLVSDRRWPFSVGRRVVESVCGSIALYEPIGLVHVDVLVEVGVRQGAINVSLFAGKAEVSDVGEDDAQWSELDCRCERLGLV